MQPASGDPLPVWLCARTADCETGEVIGERYRVVRPIGRGGTGTVYLAEHIVLDKQVALKVLSRSMARLPDQMQRFIREARAASRIGHPGIIDVTDFGPTSWGSAFFAMEYIRGRDLARHVQTDGPMAAATVWRIAVDACSALAAAHDHGIVHRDLKPENMMLAERRGQPDQIKILDFGIARMSGDTGLRLTHAGALLGTPAFMAPEQCCSGPQDHRVDIYALGCVLYELLTGTPPFDAPSVMALLARHQCEAPQPLRDRAPGRDIPRPIEAAVLRALAKQPESRFQSMVEMGAAFAACEGPLVGGRRARHLVARSVLAALLRDARRAAEGGAVEEALDLVARVVASIGGASSATRPLWWDGAESTESGTHRERAVRELIDATEIRLGWPLLGR